ncbi:hypothetical protein V2E25_01405 [Mycoplasmopsis arginini]|uniref:Uncharacterized protein n=1 Tax=Mycoplasmopsis arginini TaxID=2094 RepID=A0ABZ2AMI1_MYCAR|nr:hypothetical protein [Mycoplasmopsis arginini]WVN22238.1 hypothetical protein V2E25_01405 [Mycoplasmopsis arginini]VEU81645.1 Uncharacterised protein [Mycoplasmopsis arginini]
MRKPFKRCQLQPLKWYACEKENVFKLFNNTSKTFQDKLNQKIYTNAIKLIASSFDDLDEKLNEKIYDSIKNLRDLDKLVKIAKLIDELQLTKSVKDSNLFELFIRSNDIYQFEELWAKIDKNIRENGLDGQVLLASDLINFKEATDATKALVKINVSGRLELILALRSEFMDWINEYSIDELINYFLYTKDDFIRDFNIQLEDK